MPTARRLNIPGAILIAAVTFNAVLAIINAHVILLTPAAAIAVQSGLTGAAFSYAFLRSRNEMAPWYLLLSLLVLLFLIRSVLMFFLIEQPEPKYVAEVVTIPIFVLLGMTCKERDLDRPILIIFAIVTGVGFIEAFFPAIYSDLFNITSYYIQTRGYAETNFWAAGSTLFVSATRPNERFFDFLDAPRMSSIFLEPVSLGNFVTIMGAYFTVRFRDLPVRVVAAGLPGLVFLLIGCDGRLATISIIFVCCVCFIAPSLPRYSKIAYLPGILLIGGVFIFVTNANPGDDFPGRVANTFDVLFRQYTLANWLGLSNNFTYDAADSGVAYLIATQSLIGTALLWIFITISARQTSAIQVKYTHALLLYISLTMMVSYSFLTIKTAALAWFIHGSLQRLQTKSLRNLKTENIYVRTGLFGRRNPRPYRTPAAPVGLTEKANLQKL